MIHILTPMNAIARKRLKKLGLAIIVGLATSCLALLLVNKVDWLGHVELRISPNQGIPASPDIMVVSQTRKTLANLGLEDMEAGAPVPRRFHADLIRTLAKGGAKVVVMDYNFSDQLVEEENRLVKVAIEEAAPTVVVLGHMHEADQVIIQGEQPTVEMKGNFIRPPAPFPHVMSGSLTPYNPDQMIRGLYVRYFDPNVRRHYPHVAVLAALASRGMNGDALELSEAGDAYIAPGFRWPVGLDFEYRSRWTSRPKPFPTIEYADAIHGDPQRFRGKIVVVGSEVADKDDFATESLGVQMGHQVVAQFVNSLISPAEFQAAPTSILANGLWGWALGLMAGLLAASLRPLLFLLGVAGAGALAALAPIYVLDYASLRLETLAPFLSAIFSAISLSTLYGIKAKRFDPAHGRKPGRAVEAAIMFVDLKGSTAAISDMELSEVGAMLRQVLEALVKAIRSHGGSVERTMGDGAMAMWFPSGRGGRDAHLRQCLETVVAFRRTIEQLDAATKAKFNRDADLTIGIEVGEITGDLVAEKGHEEWSWFGAPIHLAARLQSHCGQAKVRVCIGPEMARRAGGPFGAIFLERATFKGFADPVEVYTLSETGA